jgi:hypothetical protein
LIERALRRALASLPRFVFSASLQKSEHGEPPEALGFEAS